MNARQGGSWTQLLVLPLSLSYSSSTAHCETREEREARERQRRMGQSGRAWGGVLVRHVPCDVSLSWSLSPASCFRASSRCHDSELWLSLGAPHSPLDQILHRQLIRERTLENSSSIARLKLSPIVPLGFHKKQTIRGNYKVEATRSFRKVVS